MERQKILSKCKLRPWLKVRNLNWQNLTTEAQQQEGIVQMLPYFIKQLSRFRRALLKEVFFALHLVSLKKEQNLMSPENLATIFGVYFLLHKIFQRLTCMTQTKNILRESCGRHKQKILVGLSFLGGMVNIVSSVMNPFDKSKLCRILISYFPTIFEHIDTLPLSDAGIYFWQFIVF